MKLVLHIGTEKTGTTAVQVWMHENTALLRAQGVWYAQSLGLPNNRAISVMSRNADEMEDGFHYFEISGPDEHAAFRESREKALRQDVEDARAAGALTFVISNEHCHSRLRNLEMVQRVGNLVQPLFDEVEIVGFLRPQVDMAQSLASTGSRVGMHVTKSYFDIVRPNNHYYHYRNMLDRWATVFGKDNVIPVPFKRNPSPVAFFKQHLGLDPEVDYIPDRRVNTGLDYRLVAIMNHLVGNEKGRVPRDLPPIYRRFYIEDLPCEVPLSLSLKDARQINSRFNQPNNRLVAEWPQITLDDLTPDWDKYNDVGSFDMLETADLSPYMQMIFGRFNGELEMLRAKIHLFESRDAERKGNLKQAIGAMTEALPHLEQAQFIPFMENWANEQTRHYRERRQRLMDALEEKRARGASGRPPPEPPADPAPSSGLRSVLKGIVPRRN